MVTVGAGVGHDTYLYRRQRPIAPRSNLDVNTHRMAGRRTDELLFAGELELDRATGLQGGSRTDVFGQHFLFAPKATADALAKYMNAVRVEAEEVAELLFGDVRRLRTSADMQPVLRVEPRNRTMSLEVRVLDTMRVIGAFVDGIRFGKAGRDVAHTAVNL